MLRRCLLVVLSCCLVAVLFARAQNPANSPNVGSIRGTVIDTRTGQPLAGATVNVRGMWGSEGRSSTSTSQDGTFAVHGLPAGRYRVEASLSGYVDSSRAHDGFRGFPGTGMISVGAGQNVDDVLIRLAPAGSISGKIVN